MHFLALLRTVTPPAGIHKYCCPSVTWRVYSLIFYCVLESMRIEWLERVCRYVLASSVNSRLTVKINRDRFQSFTWRVYTSIFFFLVSLYISFLNFLFLSVFFLCLSYLYFFWSYFLYFLFIIFLLLILSFIFYVFYFFFRFLFLILFYFVIFMLIFYLFLSFLFWKGCKSNNLKKFTFMF